MKPGMVEERDIVCVECPLGCTMRVVVDGGCVASVLGNSCKRGESFARQEAVLPKRNLAMVLCVPGCLEPLSVKASAPIPKELLLDAAAKVQACEVRLPIMCGDVVIPDVCPGVDIVATKTLHADKR